MTHIAVSHGADFFGLDHYPPTALSQLAPYVTNSTPYSQQADIAPLVAALETPADQEFPPDQAAQLAEQLRKVSRDHHLKGKPAAAARALADAAARAAADHDPWHWTLITQTSHDTAPAA
ncbi:hypothetical protein ACIQIG_33940 [Streptomyces bacillaris]|uniref:DUF7739 domain-containing protein n=1 Tax=Streptomyces bacillaris TaxID=68179 RepID=UPI00345F5C29